MALSKPWQGKKERREELADKEIFVDKEGIPHWDVGDMGKMEDHQDRVLLEQEVAKAEGREDKQKILGLKLRRGLTRKVMLSNKEYASCKCWTLHACR